MTTTVECPNCGRIPVEGTVHRKDEDNELCAVHNAETGQLRGFTRRIHRDMYRRNQRKQ